MSTGEEILEVESFVADRDDLREGTVCVCACVCVWGGGGGHMCVCVYMCMCVCVCVHVVGVSVRVYVCVCECTQMYVIQKIHPSYTSRNLRQSRAETNIIPSRISIASRHSKAHYL